MKIVMGFKSACFFGIGWLLSQDPVVAATFSYSYDSLNHLTNVVNSDASGESYSYDNAGNRLSRSIKAASMQMDSIPPTVPGNLVTNGFTSSELSISWNRSTDTGGSGLAGYDIFLNGSPIATSTTTNFILAGLLPSSSYCLSIAAFDRSGNVSADSTNLCLTTPLFQAPVLSSVAAANGQFQISIVGGTPGPYDILVSSNLIDWQPWTNLLLPTASSIYDANAIGRQRFYELRWRTNTP